MIDLIGCDPDHTKLAIIAAATLGCMFGCLVTQYICNRDWRRYLSQLLVQQQLPQQQFLVQRELVHHPLKEMADKDLEVCAGQVIKPQAVLEQA
jgi:hypothetical protein